MAKAYQEGSSWSIRPQIAGERLYLYGFATKSAAEAQAKHLAHERGQLGAPKHAGAHKTTVAKALQLCALERLPFLKSAAQEARRINKFLRAGGLGELVVRRSVAVDEHAARTGKLFDVTVGPAATRGAARRPEGAASVSRRPGIQDPGQRQAAQQLARRYVADVTRHEVQDFVDALRADRLSASSIALERAVLRSLFNHTRTCWHWSAPADNPATRLKMPRVDNARERVMSHDEQQRLDEALAECRNAMVAPVLTLLRETAMRSSEPLERARWGDVDWQRKVLVLRDAKAGKRDVPLSPLALHALNVLLALNAGGDPKARIVSMTYESLKAAWNRACVRAGIQNLHLHDLRHTSATRLALKTGNVFLVQALTGHKTLSQLARYVNVNADDVVEVLHAQEPPPAAAAPAAAACEAPRVGGIEVEGNVVRVQFDQRRSA